MSKDSKSPETPCTEIEIRCKIPTGAQSRLILFILGMGTLITVIDFVVRAIAKLF